MILDKSAQRCSIFGYQILVISAGYNEKNEKKMKGKKKEIRYQETVTVSKALEALPKSSVNNQQDYVL